MYAWHRRLFARGKEDARILGMLKELCGSRVAKVSDRIGESEKGFGGVEGRVEG